MQKFFLIGTLALIATILPFGANAQTPVQRKSSFNLEKSVAIQGYDPVAYFTLGKAVKGSAKFAAILEGVTYNFSTEANKKLFLASPRKYEPQYGGWCAYAMGETNEKVEIDPGTFKVVNGKLYLFYNAYFNNTLPKWNANEATLKAKADKNWLTHLK
jgi:YHS domain-containing protein